AELSRGAGRTGARVALVDESVAVVVDAVAGLRLEWVGAHARDRAAGAGDVAGVERRADDGGAHAVSGLTGIRLRAGAPVAAGGAVGLRGVRADARARVARAHEVAGIARGAHDGIRSHAHAPLAGVGLRAS